MIMSRSGVSFREWCISTGNEDLLTHLVHKSDGDKYSYASHYKVEWVCDLGHKFDKPIVDYTSYKSRRDLFNCPICNGKRVLIGYNDLETTNKDLISEWDYSKNNITPKEVTEGSHKEV